MTKKDYVAIARIINTSNRETGDKAANQARKHLLDCVANDLADIMERDNPKFDRARFLTACGVRS